ncbi:isochorismate synthase [Shewanella decolorationis]|uniref:Isochorismate synthase MenF n=1 Tax=Shewanella decolorationis TaxID=256839 RepID=A0A5B8R2X9_9GAMM|nr:isochorismate synthase [Shewanella decolorationis]QDZ92822.1 isochorismate synthase [Shewanella decolorationis]
MPAHALSEDLKSLIDKLIQLKQVPPTEPIVQLSLTTVSIPLISWLASQHQYPRIYWHGRDKVEEVAAIGACKDFKFETGVDDKTLANVYEQQRALSSNPEIRYYGGVAFDRSIESWPEFGNSRFVLPRIEFRRSNNQFSLRVNLNFADSTPEEEINRAIAAIEAVMPARPLAPPNKLTLLSRNDTPDFPRWKTLVEQVVEPKFNQETPKVVLSRHTELEVNAQVDPWMVLACWQGRNPNSFQFGFQFSPDRTYISCSPERLFRRRQQELFTEALAGTTVRGLNQEEDTALANALLEDNKNSVENQLVRRHIVSMLSPLSQHVSAEEAATIFKLNHIQHLHRAIRAELKQGVNDFQLLQALHPTPAVGGLPRQSAMNFIREREGYMRGWYAGACGYFNKYESEFSVAIRSALIEPGKINLFAGAGIIAGSDPEAEWQELENKLATIMSILIEL